MSINYDRAVFYAGVRVPVFRGMTQAQVDGCETILVEAGQRALARDAAAYILATAFWETGRKMQPVSEIGRGRTKPYGLPDPQTGQIYYGRGLVQLTWKANYEKFSKIISLDLVKDPDLALNPAVAVQILFAGMIQGLFTGKKLSDFIAGPEPDFFNARRIVNGTDKADEIAALARHFAAALVSASPPVAASSAPPGWFGRLKTYLRY